MKSSAPFMKTPHLIIRAFTDDELRARIEAAADPHEKQALMEMLEGCLAHPVERLWHTEWQIALRDGTPVGGLCFKGAPRGHEAEIGFAIDEPQRRQGYATEAVRAAVNWAFAASTELYFIMAEFEPDNDAAGRVLEKAGFVPAGEDAEGPRFELERPKMSWMAIYLCMGLSIGLSIGVSTDHLAAGMSIGMCLGLAIGTSLDAAEAKKREPVRAERGKF